MNELIYLDFSNFKKARMVARTYVLESIRIGADKIGFLKNISDNYIELNYGSLNRTC